MEYMFNAVESSFHTAECTFRPMEFAFQPIELKKYRRQDVALYALFWMDNPNFLKKICKKFVV